MKHQSELPLHMDFLLINGNPCFTIVTWKANYRTIRKCRGQGRNGILKRLQAIVARHTNRGFQVNQYHADNYFKKIEAYLLPYMPHTQAVGDHEPTSERNIRTLKYKTRSTVHLVPYRKCH